MLAGPSGKSVFINLLLNGIIFTIHAQSQNLPDADVCLSLQSEVQIRRKQTEAEQGAKCPNKKANIFGVCRPKSAILNFNKPACATQLRDQYNFFTMHPSFYWWPQYVEPDKLLQPLRGVAGSYAQILISRGLMEPRQCREVSTREYCRSLIDVLKHFMTLSVYCWSHFPNPLSKEVECDPVELRNLIIMDVFFMDDFSIGFRMLGGKFAKFSNIIARGAIVAVAPLVFVTMCLGLLILRKLVLEFRTSTFLYHFVLCALDGLTFIAVFMVAFPVGLVFANGDRCVNMDGNIFDISRAVWVTYYPYYFLESLVYLKNFLVTLIVLDRTLAFSRPELYTAYCSSNFGLKITLAAAVSSFLVLVAFIFLNFWSLNARFPKSGVYIFLTARTIIALIYLLNQVTQVTGPMCCACLMISNYMRFRRFSKKKFKVGPIMFNVLFAIYNIFVIGSQAVYLLSDTLIQLILFGMCNKCFAVYNGTGRLWSWLEMAMFSFQLLSNSASVFLHLMFLRTFRLKLVQLLRLGLFCSQLARVRVRLNNRVDYASVRNVQVRSLSVPHESLM